MTDDQGVPFKFGEKVRKLREENRFTLRDMAAKTGLPMEFLAQVEKDEVVPPVATLSKLAAALGVGMVYFFQDNAGLKKIAVTKRNDRIRIENRPHHLPGEVSYVYENLETKKRDKHMEPFLVEFPRQEKKEMVFVNHAGEEFLHVLQGNIEFRGGDEIHILEPGDSIYFESDLSHSFRCISDKKAVALVVVWNRPA